MITIITVLFGPGLNKITAKFVQKLVFFKYLPNYINNCTVRKQGECKIIVGIISQWYNDSDCCRS